jgi:uncharacterized protein (TIGR02271 family)
MPSLDTVLEWRGLTMVDRDGDKIGTIEEIYLDQETDQPEWALVRTGLFGSRSSFVPIADAGLGEGGVRVPYEKSLVKDAPNIDADQQLSPDEEATLYRHYGREYREWNTADTGTTGTTGYTGTDTGTAGWTGTETGTATGVPTGHDTSGPSTDDAMTLSEEEMRVGTREYEAGRVRLRKYIVTENVSQTVPVQRQEARIEREPITEANVDKALAGPELSEDEHEVVLKAEEPVVEKDVHPVERVRLETDTFTEQREITDEVRKERVEVEGDADVEGNRRNL